METEKPFVQHPELPSDKFAERKGLIQADRLFAVTITQGSGVRGIEQDAPHIESVAPSGYRLVRKRNGEMVLQGAFHWYQGLTQNGFEWRDIPTVDVDD